MIVDTSALIAILRDQPEAAACARALENSFVRHISTRAIKAKFLGVSFWIAKRRVLRRRATSTQLIINMKID